MTSLYRVGIKMTMLRSIIPWRVQGCLRIGKMFLENHFLKKKIRNHTDITPLFLSIGTIITNLRFKQL